MSDTCNHKWLAPYQVYPKRIGAEPERKHIEQVCVQPKGHDGPHRSLTNVITENRPPPPRLTARRLL